MRMLIIGFISVLGIFFIGLESTAFALKEKGTITREFVGCLTESDLDEFINYTSRKDFDGMRALLGKVCFSLNGKRYSVIDLGFIRVKLRVYMGGDSIALWTVTEAIK